MPLPASSSSAAADADTAPDAPQPASEAPRPSGTDPARRPAPDAAREPAADAARRSGGGGAHAPDAGAARPPADGGPDPMGHDPGVESGDEAERAPLEELDPETRARREAALSQIRQFGDPVLRAQALPVERFDEGLRAEIERMGELMVDALGVGLAATQVGVLHRLFVYRTDPEGEVRALVNPEIEHASDERERAEEGCLSIAGVQVEVERPAQVRVRARDAQGVEVMLDACGLEARVIQHELDHLDGVLILDRVSREERREAMRAMREARSAERAGDGGAAGAAGGTAGTGDGAGGDQADGAVPSAVDDGHEGVPGRSRTQA